MSNVTTYFVAADGSDQWSGTLEAPSGDKQDGPFATLTRARDAIRQLKYGAGLSGPVRVLVRGGTHYLSEPLRMVGGDSGTAMFGVSYEAYPGETPVLCGGAAITDWQPYRDKIVRAHLPEVRRGRWYFRQLFCGGRRMIRARQPKFDPNDPLYGGWAFVEQLVDEQDPGKTEGFEAPVAIRYEEGVFPHHWERPRLGEINIVAGLTWINDILAIQSVDYDARTIHLTRCVRPSRCTLGMATHIQAGNRFIVENNLEDLDSPGEWCLDPETGTVYFWPPDGQADAQVTAPCTNRLVQIIGRHDAPVHHVTFRGLTLTQTLSEFPAETDYYKTPNAGQAIYLEWAEDCAIEDCKLLAVGGDAIRLQNDNARIRITGNEIAEPGSNGIFIGAKQQGFSRHDTYSSDVPSPTEWYAEAFDQDVVLAQWPRSNDHLIHNNHIHHLGYREKHSHGIVFYGVVSHNTVISNNLIEHAPRFGIGMLSGFGRIVIEYNEIRNVCLETADTGAITVNRWYNYERDDELIHGNIIRYNFIADTIGCGAYLKTQAESINKRSGGRIWVPYYSWSIYFDNAPMDVLVYGNITVRETLGGIMISHFCKDVTVQNNIFVDSRDSQVYLLLRGDMRNIHFSRNIFSNRSKEVNFMRFNMAEGVDLTKVISEFDHNLFDYPEGTPLRYDGLAGEAAQRTEMSTAEAPDAAKWKALGFDEHSIFADPKFADRDNDDFTLAPDSPALKMGFEQIDRSKIGLVKK